MTFKEVLEHGHDGDSPGQPQQVADPGWIYHLGDSRTCPECGFSPQPSDPNWRSAMWLHFMNHTWASSVKKRIEDDAHARGQPVVDAKKQDEDQDDDEDDEEGLPAVKPRKPHPESKLEATRPMAKSADEAWAQVEMNVALRVSREAMAEQCLGPSCSIPMKKADLAIEKARWEEGDVCRICGWTEQYGREGTLMKGNLPGVTTLADHMAIAHRGQRVKSRGLWS